MKTEFQFHSDAINRTVVDDIGSVVSDFNSTLVRLTAEYPVHSCTMIRFQFHSGAINSRDVWAIQL